MAQTRSPKPRTRYRVNQQHVERVADLLADAEVWFMGDPARLSWRGQVWRRDALAIRYIFDQWAQYRAELLNAPPKGTR